MPQAPNEQNKQRYWPLRVVPFLRRLSVCFRPISAANSQPAVICICRELGNDVPLDKHTPPYILRLCSVDGGGGGDGDDARKKQLSRQREQWISFAWACRFSLVEARNALYTVPLSPLAPVTNLIRFDTLCYGVCMHVTTSEPRQLVWSRRDGISDRRWTSQGSSGCRSRWSRWSSPTVGRRSWSGWTCPRPTRPQMRRPARPRSSSP